MKTDGSYEQIGASAAAVGETEQWLKEQETYQVTLWNEGPIAVAPPNFVELEVVETDPGLKGDTATGGTKTCNALNGCDHQRRTFVC